MSESLLLPNSPPSSSLRAQAARELLLRRSVLANLIEWVRFLGYEPARHHRYICDRLMAVSRGDILRLAIFAPPGSAKTSYASIWFVVWYLANHPGALVIACSHTSDLALKWSKAVRDLIRLHGRVLDLELDEETSAASRWRLTNNSEYLAVGIGQALSGYRCDLLVIDDPVPNFEAAGSALVKEAQWNWYKADASTRLRPNGAKLIIQTRWALDDLSGRLLEAQQAGGEQWKVVSLPAVAGPDDVLGRGVGEYLWNDNNDAYGYVANFLIPEQRTQTPKNWASLFQQQPVPDGGGYFQESMLLAYIKHPPRDELSVYAGSDFAVSTRSTADWTCHVIIGVDSDNKLWLLDLWRGRTDSGEWIEKMCGLSEKWRPSFWAVETGQILGAVGPALERRLRERRCWTQLERFPSKADKGIRAQSIRAEMAIGGLRVPTNATWYQDFHAELMAFPGGRNDDQVDAISVCGQLLAKMAPGRDPKKPEPKPSDAYQSADYEGRDYVQSSVKLL